MTAATAVADKAAASDSIFVSLITYLFHGISLIPTPVLLLTPFVLLFLYAVYNLLLHPLSYIPGPLSARLGIPIWNFRHAYNGSWLWEIRKLHNRYGDVVRIGPNQLSFTDPAAVYTIYAHGGKFDKTPFYKAFQVLPERPSLFSDIDPHSHSIRRREVSHAYSMASLVDLEECVDPCVNDLIARLDRAADSPDYSTAHRREKDAMVIQEEKEGTRGRSVDMSLWLHYFASDAVGELAFGRGFHLLQTGRDPVDMLPGVTNLSLFGAVAGSLPTNWLRGLAKKALPYWLNVPGGEKIATTTVERVEERFKALKEGREVRKDMLTKFINARHVGDKRPYSQQDVLFTSTSVIAAGSDTTAVTLRALLYFLIKHPDAYARVQREIDEAVATGRLSFPVRYAQGVQLELFQACLKETLRLHPAIVWALERYVPEGGMVIAGHYVPGGTIVGVSPHVFHRTEKAFGKDCEMFKPERWITKDEDVRRKMEKNNLAFGGGARQCIGKNISLMEITKLAPALLHRYDFSFTPRGSGSPHKLPGRGVNGVEGKKKAASGTGPIWKVEEEEEEEPWSVHTAWFADQKDFWCDVKRRKENV